ncbi:MAG: aminotransferase class I/II-fold pyridoxal phosphate-dependent enzyme [Chitinophagaceae bacterium]|nr:MAG: aminotransferase class I/II-fold pyridoxal phosphate-dependent enzyme [Chitinophagaceae bacterium]
MKLSHLSETLIGSEIVKLGGEIRERIRQGETIYNFTVGDFDPKIPLIYALYRAICDKGDKVIYAVPSWNNNHYTHFVGGEHVIVEAHPEDNFMPTADNLRPHLEGAVLLSLCSPQNPTGTTFRRDDLKAICDLVVQENERRGAQEKKLYVLFDQMYWQLTYGDIEHYDPVSLHPGMRPYTIFVDAVSKVFAGTGVRVGWSMGPSVILNKMKAILSHVGAWAPMAEQKAVAKFLVQFDAIERFLAHFKKELEERLRRIYEGLILLRSEGLPVDAVAPEAAIYLTIKIDAVGRTTADGTFLQDQSAVTSYILKEAKLAVVPFYAFGAPRNTPWYRLSVGTCHKEEIDEMLGKLRAALRGLRAAG